MGGGGRKTTLLATASFFRSGYRQWRSLEESLGRARLKENTKIIAGAQGFIFNLSISFPFEEKKIL
jgi:hypothetical protein